MADRRVSTGVKGLDEMMGGGFVPGSMALLRGAPGTGAGSAHYTPFGQDLAIFCAQDKQRLPVHHGQIAFGNCRFGRRTVNRPDGCGPQ